MPEIVGDREQRAIESNAGIASSLDSNFDSEGRLSLHFPNAELLRNISRSNILTTVPRSGSTAPAIFKASRSGSNKRFSFVCQGSHTGCFLRGPFNSIRDPRRFGEFDRIGLAKKVFGEAAVESADSRIVEILGNWGFSANLNSTRHRSALCDVLVLNGSPF
ncbi:MAG: hypothetical protein WB994_10125 [Candidatus Acidiferrum sp.]